MSPKKPTQVPLPLEQTSDSPEISSSVIRRASITHGGTSWQEEEPETQIVASGSVVAPTMTYPSLFANFLSGHILIDWRYIAKIFQAGVLIGAILFTLFIFYRDNEQGRLQDTVGLQQFGMKAAAIIIYSFVLILITALILWISAKSKRRRKQKT